MPPIPMKGVARPQNAGKTLLRIFSYMKGYQLQFWIVVVCILLSSGAGIAGTYFLQPLIDNYIVPLVGQQHPDLSGFLGMIAVMAGVYLVGAFSTYLYNRLMLNISTGTLYRIRTDLFTKMQTLPIRYFDTHTHGDLMSRYTNDTDTLRDLLSQSFSQLISSTITVVGVFVMMLILSWQLTTLIILMLILMLFIISKLGKKSGMYFKKQQAAIGGINGYIEEMIEGQKVIKVFCHEEKAKEEFETLNENLRQAATGAQTFASILMPIMGNLSYANYAITSIAGSFLMLGGVFELGTVAAFLQYTRSFSQPITQMSQMFNLILNALAGAERIFNLIDEEPEQDSGYVTLVNAKLGEDGSITETPQRTGIWAWKHPHGDGTLTYTRLTGNVEFDDVTFGYEENKTVLHDISLYAKPGQKIALVGSTGAGKTTITNLLNRFYDVPDGKIRYDGINITKIKKPDLRRSLAMVLQDTHLFSGTILDNIRYGRPDATVEEVIAAAKLANADSFIRHLPQGYQTMLTGDGGNLSQGQCQLLAIARAAVADPPVLVLDEATSSIDTRTEVLIQRGMDSLMRGRTVFVIAHRLSTIQNSDAIMVMEHGRIIERGNHDELIAQKGKYYQLYTGMFELE